MSGGGESLEAAVLLQLSAEAEAGSGRAAVMHAIGEALERAGADLVQLAALGGVLESGTRQVMAQLAGALAERGEGEGGAP